LAIGRLGDARRAVDVDLTAELRPVKQQRNVGVGEQFARLARPQCGGEHQRLFVQAFQPDHPRRWAPAAVLGDVVSGLSVASGRAGLQLPRLHLHLILTRT